MKWWPLPPPFPILSSVCHLLACHTHRYARLLYPLFLTLASPLTLAFLSHPLFILYCSAGGLTLLVSFVLALTSFLTRLLYQTIDVYTMVYPPLISLILSLTSLVPTLTFPPLCYTILHTRLYYALPSAPSFPCPQPYYPFQPPCCTIVYMDMLSYSPHTGFLRSVSSWPSSLVEHTPATPTACVRIPLEPCQRSRNVGIKHAKESQSMLQLQDSYLVVQNVN